MHLWSAECYYAHLPSSAKATYKATRIDGRERSWTIYIHLNQTLSLLELHSHDKHIPISIPVLSPSLRSLCYIHLYTLAIIILFLSSPLLNLCIRLQFKLLAHFQMKTIEFLRAALLFLQSLLFFISPVVRITNDWHTFKKNSFCKWVIIIYLYLYNNKKIL